MSMLYIICCLSLFWPTFSCTDSKKLYEEVDGSVNMSSDDFAAGNHTLDCRHVWSSSVKVVIHIAMGGEDTPECICNGRRHPCKTIQHAYTQATQIVANSTKNMTFIFHDEIFKLSKPLFIDKPMNSLQWLEIKSLTRTTIVADNSTAVFWLGCNNTKSHISCLSYSFAIEKLIFKNFGSDYPAVLVVFTLRNLQISNCEFNNNNCSAINSLETFTTIRNTRFVQNRGTANFKEKESDSFFGFPKSNISNGGALAFIFETIKENSVMISNCTFTENMAAKNLQLPFIAHNLEDTQFPRVGGSILILFMKNCSMKSVSVIGSNFTKNVAYSAGAIAILCEGFASNNQVILKSDKFEQNIATSTSGAILFANWDYSHSNYLIIEGSQFKHNNARFAGAIKYLVNNLFHLAPVKFQAPLLQISNTEFCVNHALTGSAIHLILGSLVNRNPEVPVHITNATFCQNDVPIEKTDSQTMSQFGGTILTHKIDIKFLGTTTVKNNKDGCGLYASNANIHVAGSLIFEKNVALSSGGAMTLADSSHLVLYPGSHLRFEGNHAGTKGGALAVFSVGMPELTYVYNPFCFIQYSIRNLPYSKWDIKVEFIKNSAELKGAAIFINTITACLWTEEYPHRSFSKALKWNEKFVYQDNYVTNMYNNLFANSKNGSLFHVDIATDTSRFELGDPKEVALAPGETMHFNLSAYDELNSEAYSVPIATAIAHLKDGKEVPSDVELPNKYFVLDPFAKTKKLPLFYEIDKYKYGKINESVLHGIQFFDTYSSFITKATLNLTLLKCHPGFRYNDKGVCFCNSDEENTKIKSCSGTKVILKDGLWGTAINGKLNSFYCPDNYCKCTKSKEKTDCIYDSRNENDQCLDGRSGVLCGKCIGKNKCISLYNGSCIDVSEVNLKRARGGLAFIVIGIVLAAVAVVYLNPSFSTSMRGPVFYVQMLPYLFTNSSEAMAFFINGVASLIALGGSSGLPILGCLGSGWNRLDIIALTYVFAVAILLILLMMYILSRCYILHFVRDSPFESFWILLIATYCFFSETSLIFFRCTEIDGRSAFFYDGTVDCYKGQHLYMVIASSVLLVVFVLLPPVLVMMMCYGKINVPLQVIDALTKGLRKEFRWWWAADLCRRFAFIAVFVFINLRGVRQVVYIILSNIILTVHAFCQPYISSFANMSETFLLLSMTTIATLQLAATEGTGMYVASGIIIANYAYMVCLFFYKLFFFVRRRLRSRFPLFFRRLDDAKIATPSRPQTPGRVENMAS